MRILFVGDVVGRSGRTAIADHLPGMIRDYRLDLVIVNGENAAGGFGITESIYTEMIDAGADAITGGNHSWDQREALVFIEQIGFVEDQELGLVPGADLAQGVLRRADR